MNCPEGSGENTNEAAREESERVPADGEEIMRKIQVLGEFWNGYSHLCELISTGFAEVKKAVLC
jgi:hypothetical protein